MDKTIFNKRFLLKVILEALFCAVLLVLSGYFFGPYKSGDVYPFLPGKTAAAQLSLKFIVIFIGALFVAFLCEWELAAGFNGRFFKSSPGSNTFTLPLALSFFMTFNGYFTGDYFDIDSYPFSAELAVQFAVRFIAIYAVCFILLIMLGKFKSRK